MADSDKVHALVGNDLARDFGELAAARIMVDNRWHSSTGIVGPAGQIKLSEIRAI